MRRAGAGLTLTPGVRRVMLGLDIFIASFAIGATVDWLANFALIQVFSTWQSAIGLAWVLVCFAGLCVLAIVFIAIYLPETKGLSVDEIIHLYERSPSPNIEPRGV